MAARKVERFQNLTHPVIASEAKQSMLTALPYELWIASSLRSSQ
jgi:hypothetical protein